jgi:hypothetical protein
MIFKRLREKNTNILKEDHTSYILSHTHNTSTLLKESAKGSLEYVEG